MDPVRIISLTPEGEQIVQQAAHLLVEAFREHWPDAWPTIEEGRKEVGEMLESGRICRAVDSEGNLLRIIGGIPGYDGRVWELHPLAVRPFRQGQGIGRALVDDLEDQVRLQGGLTITLGTDDEAGMTSLSNTDLYENLWEKISAIRNLKGHPYEFYRKLGYIISGVVPDANGPGKPDILTAKRLGIQQTADGLHYD